MDHWELSDGTEIYLGGEIVGDGPAAEWCRRELALLEAGESVTVPMFPPPDPYSRMDLDVDSAPLMHAFAMDAARFNDETVVSAPEFEPMEHPDGDEYYDGLEDLDPDVIY